jgi:hypothetical protein
VGRWSAAEDSFAEDVDELVEVAETSGGEALVGLADEEVDVRFVFHDEGLNVGVIEEFGALGLGEDEVGEEDEADPGVEGEPADDEDGP